jgi:hypothetical protein
MQLADESKAVALNIWFGTWPSWAMLIVLPTVASMPGIQLGPVLVTCIQASALNKVHEV